MGRTAFTEVKCEKLRLFRRYCEGTGKRKQEKIIKKEKSNWRIFLKQAKDNFEASEGKWSEGKEAKKYNANK